MNQFTSMFHYRLVFIAIFISTQIVAQSSWQIVADKIDPSHYYGVTVANGMIGIVSSAEPLKVKDVVLNGVYDNYQRGRVSNILKGFNHVNMQMDIGNCLGGDGDPIGSLKKFPGRSFTVHIKEYKEKTFDSEYYKEVFRLCETVCATRWYIVEMGSADGTGFTVPREALASLRRVGKA